MGFSAECRDRRGDRLHCLLDTKTHNLLWPAPVSTNQLLVLIWNLSRTCSQNHLTYNKVCAYLCDMACLRSLCSSFSEWNPRVLLVSDVALSSTSVHVACTSYRYSLLLADSLLSKHISNKKINMMEPNHKHSFKPLSTCKLIRTAAILKCIDFFCIVFYFSLISFLSVDVYCLHVWTKNDQSARLKEVDNCRGYLCSIVVLCLPT